MSKADSTLFTLFKNLAQEKYLANLNKAVGVRAGLPARQSMGGRKGRSWGGERASSSNLLWAALPWVWQPRLWPGRLTPMWQEDVPQMTANRDVTGCPSQARPCPLTSAPITPVRKQNKTKSPFFKKRIAKNEHKTFFFFFFPITKQHWESVPCVSQSQIETKRAYLPALGKLRNLFCLCFILVNVEHSTL